METTDIQSEGTKVTEKVSETNVSKPKVELKSLGEYNREILQKIPRSLLRREPTRLKYGVLFSALAFACGYAIYAFEFAWYAKLPLSIMMGVFLAGNTFLAHEILHGAIVKNKRLQTILGFVGFAPFLISPTYWRFWHNVLHHGNTQLLYKDPDAFPTKMVWKRSKFMKFVFPLSPGSGYLRSYVYFFYWFSFQAVLNQVYMRFGNKMWEKMNHKQVTREFIFMVALVVGYLFFVGFENWLWMAIIPFMAQNYTVMSYISTNHNISPLTRVNDPLVNSLTVSNNPILEFLHLNFGYHTEHHLFPGMPASKAKIISKTLREMYPDKYMIMPKFKAVKMLYSTPRIYKNRETLIHPETDKEYQTLGREHVLQ